MPNPIAWLFAIIIILFPAINNAQDLILREPVRFLALGDSYTIGEQVQVADRWPQQLYDSIDASGFDTEKLTIIASTGWTTEDLLDAILAKNPPKDYNLVSLLIGVNDQYQGYDLDWYKSSFEELLLMAIELAQGNKNAVFVVSIPDYAYTPFGNGSNSITKEIDAFNSMNKSITQSNDITYIDITPISREGLANPSLVAADGLHPSNLMYTKWVSLILRELTQGNVTGLTETLPEEEKPVVFPNPADDSVNFLLTDSLKDVINIKVYNVSGHLIGSINSKGLSTVPFKTSNMEPGIFYYILRTEDGKIFTGKFIKI